jgi:hypothetical protein
MNIIKIQAGTDHLVRKRDQKERGRGWEWNVR